MKLAAWNPAVLKSLVTQGGRYVNFGAPVMIVVAAVSVWFGVTQMEKAIASGRQTIVNSKSKSQTPVIKQNPLPIGVYQDAASVLAAANPAIKVSLGKTGHSVVVSITDPALMPEWFYLLSTVQSYRSGLIWTADRICLKNCDGGNAAFAEIKAYTQEVSVKDLIS